MSHPQAHPQARETVKVNIKGSTSGPQEYRLEDYWDRVSGGQSWEASANSGNPAALNYMARARVSGLPLDNEVVYGKIGSFGHLVHVSEIE